MALNLFSSPKMNLFLGKDCEKDFHVHAIVSHPIEAEEPQSEKKSAATFCFTSQTQNKGKMRQKNTKEKNPSKNIEKHDEHVHRHHDEHVHRHQPILFSLAFSLSLSFFLSLSLFLSPLTPLHHNMCAQIRVILWDATKRREWDAAMVPALQPQQKASDREERDQNEMGANRKNGSQTATKRACFCFYILHADHAAHGEQVVLAFGFAIRRRRFLLIRQHTWWTHHRHACRCDLLGIGFGGPQLFFVTINDKPQKKVTRK